MSKLFYKYGYLDCVYNVCMWKLHDNYVHCFTQTGFYF